MIHYPYPADQTIQLLRAVCFTFTNRCHIFSRPPLAHPLPCHHRLITATHASSESLAISLFAATKARDFTSRFVSSSSTTFASAILLPPNLFVGGGGDGEGGGGEGLGGGGEGEGGGGKGGGGEGEGGGGEGEGGGGEGEGGGGEGGGRTAGGGGEGEGGCVHSELFAGGDCMQNQLRLLHACRAAPMATPHHESAAYATPATSYTMACNRPPERSTRREVVHGSKSEG